MARLPATLWLGALAWTLGGAAPVTVSGRVLLGSGRDDRPVGRELVVLHRIAANKSGPLDSVRTDASGRFRFAIEPASEGVYILSAQYRGIAYFSTPFRGDSAASDLDIQVFDTTLAGHVALAQRGRHVIISRPDDSGNRAVVEVFELANDSSVTVVSPPSGAPTFAAKLPPAARKPLVGQGDIAAASVSFASGEARVTAPFAPGLKQLVVSYELPPSAFPLTLPLGGAATVLEVLLEEMTGRATGAGLTPREGVSVEGRQFQRFLAQDAAASGVVEVSLPPAQSAAADGPASQTRFIWIALIAAIAASLWLYFRRRPASGVLVAGGGSRSSTAVTAHVPAARAVPNESLVLARQIADLDIAFESMTNPGLPDRAIYEAQRKQLKSRLTAALAESANSR
jgi:hypothetical protein